MDWMYAEGQASAGVAPSVLVLAGGAGRRLGREKWGVQVGGLTLLERVVRALEGLAGEVVLVMGPGQRPPGPRLAVPLRVVEDLEPGRGPLMGLYSGLLAVSSAYAWAVACDMPFLNPQLLDYLMRKAPGYEAVVPLVGGRLHPLHAVYSRGVLDRVEVLLRQGGASLHRLLDHLHLRVVEEGEYLGPGAWGRSVFNVNTPQDLALARRWAGGP